MLRIGVAARVAILVASIVYDVSAAVEMEDGLDGCFCRSELSFKKMQELQSFD